MSKFHNSANVLCVFFTKLRIGTHFSFCKMSCNSCVPLKNNYVFISEKRYCLLFLKWYKVILKSKISNGAFFSYKFLPCINVFRHTPYPLHGFSLHLSCTLRAKTRQAFLLAQIEIHHTSVVKIFLSVYIHLPPRNSLKMVMLLKYIQ